MSGHKKIMHIKITSRADTAHYPHLTKTVMNSSFQAYQDAARNETQSNITEIKEMETTP